MSKRNGFNWGFGRLKRLQKIIGRYNEKVDSTNESYAPPKLTSKKVKNRISSFGDLVRVTSEIKRFMKRGASRPITSKSGLTLTNYEIREAKRKAKRVTKKRKQRKKEYVKTIKTTSKKRDIEVKQKKVSTNKSRKAWDKSVATMDNELRKEYTQEGIDRYKENYIKAITDNLGDIEALEKIKKMSSNEVFEIAMNNPFMEIKFVYSPSDVEARIAIINEEWEND